MGANLLKEEDTIEPSAATAVIYMSHKFPFFEGKLELHISSFHCFKCNWKLPD